MTSRGFITRFRRLIHVGFGKVLHMATRDMALCVSLAKTKELTESHI